MQKKLIRGMSLLLLGVLLAGFFAPAVQASAGEHATNFANGQIYYINCVYAKTNGSTGTTETMYRSWDVSAGNTANGADVAHYTKNLSTTWQQWQLRDMGDGYYAFVDMNSGKYLTHVSAETKAGIENYFLQTYGSADTVPTSSSVPHDLRIYEPMGLDCQKFTIRSVRSDRFYISPKGDSNKVVTAIHTETLMTLALEDVISNDSRQWFYFEIHQTSGVVPGEAYNLINKSSDRAFTVPGGGKGNGMFITDEQYYSATPWQRWQVVYEGAGNYVLRDENSGNLLSIGGSDPNAGGRVWTYVNDGTTGQRFQIVRNADGTYSFLSKCSNYTMALTLQPSGTFEVGSYDQQPFVRSDNQKFYLALNGIYNVKNRATQKSLDVSSGYTANGSDVSQYQPTFGTLWQQWHIAYAGGGKYRITDMNSGKLLSIAGSSSAERANVHIWAADGTTGQGFKIDGQSTLVSGNYQTYYTFYSECSGYTKGIGVEGNNNGDTFLQLTVDGAPNKQFELTKLRTDPVAPGMYYFQCVATDRYMEKDSSDNFAEQQRFDVDDMGQVWRLQYESESYYSIVNVANNRYLTVQESNKNKLKVKLEQRDNVANTSRLKWTFRILPNGKWEIQAQYHQGTALVLAVGQPAFNSSLFENGVNIEQRNDNTDRDEWRLCRTMNTQWVGQGATNWCWATAAKMVAMAYEQEGQSYPSRNDAVIRKYGSLNQDGGGSASDIVDACEYLTNFQVDFSHYSKGEIYSEGMLHLLLDDGNPMVLAYNTAEGNLGHTIVVYGYYYQGNQCYFLYRDSRHDPKDPHSEEEYINPKTYDELQIYIDYDEETGAETETYIYYIIAKIVDYAD